MEKQEIPKYEKEKGNEEFKNNNYLQCIKHYSKSLMGLDLLIKDQIIKADDITWYIHNI